MSATNQKTPSLQDALNSWSDEGGEWLKDADRILAETQQLLRNLEEQELSLQNREESLDRWQRNLENREKLLLEREKLLTDGMLELETSNRDGANSLLNEITREIADLRKSLVHPNAGCVASESTEPEVAATIPKEPVPVVPSPLVASSPASVNNLHPENSRRSKRRSRR